MMEIDIYDETGTLSEEMIGQIDGLLNVAASSELIEDGTEVSVTFVDDDRIHELNRTYRNIDRPTDVLSFALQEEGEGELKITGGDSPQTLGDIIVSIPRAKEQAESYNHSLLRELGFLVVHGFLHLCGYDHMTEADEQRMFSRQKEILESYGLQR